MAAGKRKGTRESRGARGRERRGLGQLLADFVLGSGVDDETAARLGEIKGLLLIGGGLLLFLSLVSFYTPYDAHSGRALPGYNWVGQAGYYSGYLVLAGAGWSGYWLCFLAWCWGGVLVARKRADLPVLRVAGGVCLLASSAFLLQLALGDRRGIDNELPYGPGGWFALQLVGPTPNAASAPFLIDKLGRPGSWVVLILLVLVSFLLATQMAFYPALSALWRWLADVRKRTGETPVRAIAGWFQRLGQGLWSFLTGADLVLVPQAAGGPSGATGLSEVDEADEADPDSDDAAEPDADGAAASARAEARRVPAWERDDDGEDESTAPAVKRRPGQLFPDPEDGGDEEADDGASVASESGRGVAKSRKKGSGRARATEPDAADEGERDDERDDERGALSLDGSDASDTDADPENGEPDVDLVPEPRTAVARKGSRARAETPPEPITPPPGPWKFPPLELLESASARTADDERLIESSARKLEQALGSFRVEATVVGAKVGPTVTLFELEVTQGTRLNKVTQLSSEIAAALRAKSVRIIAPIPGKATIGIEVPNTSRRVVRLSELVTPRAYDPRYGALPLFLGVDTEGAPIVEDLARMPHLLIAGTTGSGKSVCINAVLASLLLTRSPHDVKLILIDPKMVELQVFAQVPHLMLPVVTDAKHATQVLLWMVEKMEGRYELFQSVGVRNVKAYNALGEEQLRARLGEAFSDERTPRHVPYIVLVVDEMADLMMTSKKEAEMAITRLAQKSRAVGIHVIVATQRPSTDVITGVIKGNLPTRIAFQVASKIDSRVILDASGAEKLLGQGDMLYTPPQASQIKRVQGALVEDHELQALVDFVCREAAPTFSQELVQVATGEAGPGPEGSMDPEEDDMWDPAVRVILKSRRGSASLLQRALGVGYTRASRLIDMMSAQGILGEFQGSKARAVLMTLDQWEEQHGRVPSDAAGDQGDA